MNKSLHVMFVSVLAGALPWGAVASAGLAGQIPQGAVKVSGRIRVTKGGRLNAQAAAITTSDGDVYNLVLDEKGRDFAKVMHRERAEIFGTVSRKGGAKWLKVLGYTDIKVTAAHELWRRMRCNACVFAPAMVNSAAPKDLGGAEAVSGRYYSMKGQFQAYARDARYLWVATDNRIFQIDLAKKLLLRSYDHTEGLPDQVIEQLVSDGKVLWIVHRAGVAALTIGGKSISEVLRLKSSFARIFADGHATWIIADTGTFRFKSAGDSLKAAPALPTAGRIARSIRNGIWTPHRKRQTRHFITTPASVAGRLYVGSYGDIYELADGKWSKIAPQSWELTATADRIWFISSKGLGHYDPTTRKRVDHMPPEISQGRYTHLLMTEKAAWVAAEPIPSSLGHGQSSAGGGLGRFDLASRKWQTWQQINGRKADRITCLKEQDSAVWAVAATGRHSTKSAHPGMSYVKREVFEPTGFCLHRFDEKTGRWDSFPLKRAELETRLICGQDGGRATDVVVPQVVRDICVGPGRVFGSLRLVSRKYFSGYWSCVNQVASRRGVERAWKAEFRHRPEQLNLQGEQPLVLDISNKGELILKGVGHDDVLGLFHHDGTHWAVTEGCVGWFDPAPGNWRKVLEMDFRFYWRATCALEEGRRLYIGSDRGLVSRLDLDACRFEILICLRDRSISRIARNKAGQILVASRPAPLGMLAVQLRGKVKTLDCETARFDGKTWTKARPDEMPPADSGRWFIKKIGRRHRKDKSKGNFLCGPAASAGEARPRFYVKEVFFPQFLCTAPDKSRIWLSTFTGLLRLDVRTAHY